MVEVSFHNVVRVSVKKADAFGADSTRSGGFASRRIVATDGLGRQVTLVLFADTEEQLLIHDADGECIERMPDPPDCSECRGQGMIAEDEAGTPVTCPSCNGEGVAQS